MYWPNILLWGHFYQCFIPCWCQQCNTGPTTNTCVSVFVVVYCRQSTANIVCKLLLLNIVFVSLWVKCCKCNRCTRNWCQFLLLCWHHVLVPCYESLVCDSHCFFTSPMLATCVPNMFGWRIATLGLCVSYTPASWVQNCKHWNFNGPCHVTMCCENEIKSPHPLLM